MIEIARERTIHAAAARVWAVVAEAERLPEWWGRAGSVEVLEGSGLGRRQRLRSQWQGQALRGGSAGHGLRTGAASRVAT